MFERTRFTKRLASKLIVLQLISKQIYHGKSWSCIECKAKNKSMTSLAAERRKARPSVQDQDLRENCGCKTKALTESVLQCHTKRKRQREWNVNREKEQDMAFHIPASSWN